MVGAQPSPESSRAGAQKTGNRSQIFRCPAGGKSNQADPLSIAEDEDVIAFSPVVETGFEPGLREAKKAGIPVVLSDRAVKLLGSQLFDLIEKVANKEEIPKCVVSQEGVYEQSQKRTLVRDQAPEFHSKRLPHETEF
jgi:hypothetical protein